MNIEQDALGTLLYQTDITDKGVELQKDRASQALATYKIAFEAALKKAGMKLELIWNQEENRATDMANFIESLKQGKFPEGEAK